MNRTTILALCIASLLGVANARAATIVGGSELLSAANADQLESWLNEGPLTLTRIFAKDCDDNGYDFHAAVDGKGATFTVIEVENHGYVAHQIIGGYNPQSWHSGYDYNVSSVANRDAFLFNLTENTLQSQKNDEFGAYQTYNGAEYGPIFGGGHDIYVKHDLSKAKLRHYSFGPTTLNDNIVMGTSSVTNIRIGKLEVFSVAPSFASALDINTAPEPASLAIWGLGALGCVGATAWRKRKAARR